MSASSTSRSPCLRENGAGRSGARKCLVLVVQRVRLRCREGHRVLDAWAERLGMRAGVAVVHHNVTASEIRLAMAELRGFTLGIVVGTTSGRLTVTRRGIALSGCST